MELKYREEIVDTDDESASSIVQSVTDLTLISTTNTSLGSKIGFLSLPQELRDEVYSYLPLTTEQPISLPVPRSAYAVHYCHRLSALCRTTRTDVAKIFWSRHRFIIHLDNLPQNNTLPLTDHSLSFVQNIKFVSSFAEPLCGRTYSLSLNVVKKKAGFGLRFDIEGVVEDVEDLQMRMSIRQRARAMVAQPEREMWKLERMDPGLLRRAVKSFGRFRRKVFDP